MTETDQIRVLSDIAGLFHVSDATIRRWIAAGMPVVEHGSRGGRRHRTRIDLQAAVAWYFAHNHERLELMRARTRLANEQADKTRMENEVRSQDLAEISIIEEVVADLVRHLRAVMLALPGQIAPELATLDARQRESSIDRRIRDALERVSTYRAKRPAAEPAKFNKQEG